ncbi:MAG: hypothetical protein RL748_4201, partial [Pseudomonadota bacterium]
TGPIGELAGLQFSANGKALPWLRDPTNMYAFKLDIPKGVSRLDARYQFLSPLGIPGGSGGRVVFTQDMLGLQWNTVALYPAGMKSDDVTVQANLNLPPEWDLASALQVAQREGNLVRFKSSNLTQLLDSPVYAGKYSKKVQLDNRNNIPVTLNLFADHPESLALEPEQLAAHRQLVQQAYSVFGAPHYQHYDFLVAMSNYFSQIGLEHGQSTEIGVRPELLTSWKTTASMRTVIPHEYVHAWNGKFRRPLDLLTPHYNVPMQNSLLWLYEGQTTYWTVVLSARANFLTQEQARENWALMAALLSQRAGRAWRNLRDTTNEPIYNHRRGGDWRDWQRSADYYPEGALLWLDVDSKIRELTGDKKSLDQFAQSFFSVPGSHMQPVPYTFADIVKALNNVVAHDWAGFLNTRLDSNQTGHLLDGFERSGWKLVYTDKPNDFAEPPAGERRDGDFRFSLGFTVGKNDQINNVVWGGPAFQAGIAGNTTLVAVNGRSYKFDLLKRAVVAAKTSTDPIELLLRTEDRYHTVKLDYHGGLRYPHLEAISGVPDRLTTLMKPL